MVGDFLMQEAVCSFQVTGPLQNPLFQFSMGLLQAHFGLLFFRDIKEGYLELFLAAFFILLGGNFHMHKKRGMFHVQQFEFPCLFVVTIPRSGQHLRKSVPVFLGDESAYPALEKQPSFQLQHPDGIQICTDNHPFGIQGEIGNRRQFVEVEIAVLGLFQFLLRLICCTSSSCNIAGMSSRRSCRETSLCSASSISACWRSL
jgi:hypothetical protein